MAEFVVFDTETNGLVKNLSDKVERQPRMLELAAVKMLSDGSITEEYERLFHPGSPVSAETTKITGITNEMLKDARPFREHADEVGDFFNGATYLVGHNVMFDVAILNFEYMRLPATVHSNYAFRTQGFRWPNERLICTVEQTEHLLGKRANLSVLHTHLFGAGFEGAHRAMTDVKATARCLAELIKRGLI